MSRLVLYLDTDMTLTVTATTKTGAVDTGGSGTVVTQDEDGGVIAGGSGALVEVGVTGVYEFAVPDTLSIARGDEGVFAVTFSGAGDSYAEFPWRCRLDRR